jgi:hypothetical protein
MYGTCVVCKTKTVDYIMARVDGMCLSCQKKHTAVMSTAATKIDKSVAALLDEK